MLRRETLLEVGVALDETGIGAQRITKGQLLTPASVAEQHHVQVCDTVPLSDLYEESTPSAGIEFRLDVVPTGGGQSNSDIRRAIERPMSQCSAALGKFWGKRIQA
jgi:hypothetical protein